MLLGVAGGAVVADATSPWMQPGAPALVDLIRDRLRTRIDPLPPFECRVMDSYPGGPLGVIRVYESSDTPHVLTEGLIYVREPAGARTLANTAGDGPDTVRVYETVEVSSRAELIELASRGRTAEARVQSLLERSVGFPLIRAVGVDDPSARHEDNRTLVITRIALMTHSSRFRPSAASAEAARAACRAAEVLADTHGLSSDWITPDPAGIAVLDVPISNPPHSSTFRRLTADARTVIDGAGIAAAAIQLEAPDRASSAAPTSLPDTFILPTLRSAAAILEAGEFVGRSRCKIDLMRLSEVVLLEGQGDRRDGDAWLPFEADLILRADDQDLALVARKAVYAYARSARLRHWHQTDDTRA